VFPVGSNKKPRIKEWQHRATTDPEQVEKWWTRWPDSNIGMATGPRSGFVVVDADNKDSLRVLIEELNGGFAPTRAVKTPRGGLHLYFTYPDGAEVRNSASKLAPGVDIRGDGGYVIVPPSTGYTHGSVRVIRHLPERWLVRLTEPDTNGSLPLSGDRIPDGFRHSRLHTIGSAVRGQGGGFDEVLDAMRSFNERRGDPPQPRNEVEYQARWIVNHYSPNVAAGLLEELNRRAVRRQADQLEHVNGIARLLSDVGKYREACERVLNQFRLLDLDNLFDQGMDREDVLALDPPTWMIKQCVPLGDYMCMYGPPDTFKTFIAHSMCEAVTRGQPWFGYKVTKGVAAYYSGEGRGQFQPRLHAYDVQHGRPSRDAGALRIWEFPLDLSQQATLVSVTCALEELRGTATHGLCVFDPSGLFRGGDPGDVENYEAMAVGMKALARGLPQWGFVAVGHTDAKGTRQRGTDHLKQLSGAHARVEPIDEHEIGMCWEKQRAAAHPAVYVQPAVLSEDVGGGLVVLNSRPARQWTMSDYVHEKAARAADKDQKRRDKIIGWVRAEPGVKQTPLRGRGIGPTELKTLLDAMVKDGTLNKASDGGYTLP
jgi:hypothetical protein